jgi:hypothetical protein
MNHLILENQLIICELDESIPVLKHRWTTQPTSDEFRNQLIELQKVYLIQKKKYPKLKWLADTALLGELTHEDEEWLENVWEKLLFEDAEVKVHGVILGDDIFADYSMEYFKQKADKAYSEKGVKIGIFMDEEEAYEWLVKTE